MTNGMFGFESRRKLLRMYDGGWDLKGGIFRWKFRVDPAGLQIQSNSRKPRTWASKGRSIAFFSLVRVGVIIINSTGPGKRAHPK